MNTFQTHPMWIILDVTELRKQAYERVTAIVHEMGGSVVQAFSLDDLVVLARFPHRKYRAVEKAVAEAVCRLPVKQTTVYPRDPYALRKPPELCRRRDEAGPEPQASIGALFEDG